MNENEIYLNKIKELLTKKKNINRERVEEELEAIKGTHNSKRLYIGYLVASFFKEDNQKYKIRGTLNDSYIAYLLGITNFNPLDYRYIDEERHYELPYESAFGYGTRKLEVTLDFDISDDYYSRIVEKCKKRIFENSEIGQSYQIFDSEHDSWCSYRFNVFPKEFDLSVNYKECGPKYESILPVLEHRGYVEDECVRLYFIKNERTTRLNRLISKCGEADLDKGKEALDESINNDDYSDLIYGVYNLPTKNVSDFIHNFGLLHGTFDKLDKTQKRLVAYREDIINLLKDNNPANDVFMLSDDVRRGRIFNKIAKPFDFISSNKDELIKEFNSIKYLFPKCHIIDEALVISQLAYYKKYKNKEYLETIGEGQMKEFKNVIGYKAEKLEMYRILDTMSNPEKYKKLGVETSKGLLLFGEPGVGKTLMANCFIKASKRKVYTIRKNIPDGKFVEQIEKTFAKAAKEAPSIVFLDDMDKFANGDINHKNPEEYVTIQSCIDECKEKNVYVIATANDLDNVPRSLLRKGRFDTIIEMENPTGKNAELIVKHYLKKKKCDKTVNPAEIARLLDGKSCAILESVINEAAIYAGYENRGKVSKKDLIRSFMRYVYNAPEEVEESISQYRLQIAYHEAGHALVSELLEKGSVNFVTIAQHTGDIGGFVNFKNNDDYFNDIEFMKNRVRSLLAGKAANEVVFGKIDVGAGKDIRRAFAISRRFVEYYCLNGFQYWGEGDLSQKMKERIENATSSEMEKLYAETKMLIAQNISKLNQIAHLLMENTVLFSEDVGKIINENS